MELGAASKKTERPKLELSAAASVQKTSELEKDQMGKELKAPKTRLRH
jgi:hypothetical protein